MATVTTGLASAPPLHSGMSVCRYYSMHFLGALFPLTAGLMLFGWRAAMATLVVMTSTLLAMWLWRNIGSRGRQLDAAQALWLSMLLALMLPPHLFSGSPDESGGSPWPILAFAGGVLVMVLWVLGGLGVGRFHPALVTILLLFIFFQRQMTPHWVLQRGYLVAGDVLRGPLPGSIDSSSEPWIKRRPARGQDSYWLQPPAQHLIAYTTGRLRPERGQVPLHELLRDRMPPLEDLIVAGQPTAIGCASGIAVIIGGLFLLYRGLIDFRIPLFITIVAFGAMLVLPMPTVIREAGTHWRWLAMREPDVRWETAVTFVNYEMMASPILFVAFFLASAPALRPLARRARVLYAILVGLLCAAAQLYLSVSFGPYVALLLGSFASPVFDHWFRPRPLV
jgi:electron transport complex protein RnfD